MKKNLFLMGFAAILCLTACGPSSNPTTSGPTSDPTSNPTTNPTTHPTTAPTTSVGPTTKPTITIDEESDYDTRILEWSKKDHLYIHYTRGNDSKLSDYDPYAFWIWEASPKSSAGGIFGNTSTIEGPSKNFVNNNVALMSDIGGKGSVDEAGVCLEIDLKADYVTGDGDPLSFANSIKLGFLVVLTETMGGGTHWTSDGGSDTFFTLENARQDNGSYHIYLVSGSVTTPRYKYNDKQVVNPVTKDTTGQYSTVSDIPNSSTTTYGRSSTSKKFYDTAGVGYQIFVPTFNDSNNDGMGDLRGIINKLDYIESLSVDTLWLTPFLECNSYHGYDTVDYFKVDPRFGTNEDFQELIFKAHERGIKVLMDLVINHASTASDLFKKAQRAEKGVDLYGHEFEYRNMFHFLMEGQKTQTGDLVENDPDWHHDGESKYYYYAKFGDNMPDFNYDYQATRDYVRDIGLYWLGKGVDGFRLDAIKHIYMADEVKQSSGDKILDDVSSRTFWDEQIGDFVTEEKDYSTNETKNIAFWKEFANELKAIYPDCYLVGENFDGWDQRMAPLYQAIDSQFDFNSYYHNTEYVYLHSADGPYSVTNAGKLALATDTKLNTYFKQQRSQLINSAFTSNHDVLRAINQINATKTGTEYNCTKITGTADQINKAKIHAAITMLQPGLSFIYYGDELGMSSNLTENKLNHENHIDRFYRQPMKWAEEAERPFITISKGIDNSYDSYNATLKNVDEQDKDTNSMLSFYKAICAIKARADFPKNGTYTGYEWNGAPSMLHYQISGTEGTFKFYIHTAGNDKTPVNYSLNGETAVYKYNATDTTIQPYGIVVTKVN